MKADCKFRFLVKGIQLLILKVDRDIHLFQFLNNSQNIHRVSGKSAEGIGVHKSHSPGSAIVQEPH